MRHYSPKPSFEVVYQNDLLVLIIDLDYGPTITNYPESVIAELGTRLPGGLGTRKLVYRDTEGWYCQLIPEDLTVKFKACTREQQSFYSSLWSTV